MKFLEHVRQDIQKYFGSRGGLKPHSTGIKGDVSKPDHLGLFFCISSKEELDEIRILLNRLKNRYNKVTANVFVSSDETLDVISNTSIFLFNFRDFDLFGRKKGNLEERFKNDHYGLLISFTFEPDLFCRKLVSEINAGFKIGPGEEEGNDLYDMIIGNEKEKTNYTDYFDNVIHYLEVLNLKQGINTNTGTDNNEQEIKTG